MLFEGCVSRVSVDEESVASAWYGINITNWGTYGFEPESIRLNLDFGEKKECENIQETGSASGVDFSSIKLMSTDGKWTPSGSEKTTEGTAFVWGLSNIPESMNTLVETSANVTLDEKVPVFAIPSINSCGYTRDCTVEISNGVHIINGIIDISPNRNTTVTIASFRFEATHCPSLDSYMHTIP